MKKIFNLIASFVLLAGFSACNKDGSDKPGLPPAPVPTVNYKGLTFISSGKSTVCLAKVGAPIVTIISRFPVPSVLKGISCHC